MRRKRAVITGGSGFLGSHLCDGLVAQGYEVICLDNFCTGSIRNLDHLRSEKDFHLIEADVTKHFEIDCDVDAVLHFASPASPADYMRMPVETMRVGSIGTHHALDLARSKGARFVLASTSEVYGDPLVHPQSETYWGNVNPTGPRSVYDEAKRYSEALTAAFHRYWGVDARIVRIFNTFGPRMRSDDGRMIPNFIRQALGGEPITVAGDGRQTRSVCYVTDTADGILRSLHADHIPGPVNIGGSDEMSVLEFAHKIKALTGSGSPIIFTQLPQDDPRMRCPDIRRAIEVLGWRPRIGVQEGLAQTIKWFSGR